MHNLELETARPALPHDAMSLPARYYIDPEYYRAELEWFFFNMWVHAGRAEEIPGPGDFLVREIAGESVIVVRREGGGLSAYYNVCRHRGTRLTENKSGRFASDDPVSLPRLDLWPERAPARRAADGSGRWLSIWKIIRSTRPRSTSGTAISFSTSGKIPSRSRSSLAAWTSGSGHWGMDQLRSGRRDRLRRRRQLEADHPQLFGMSALPRRSSGTPKTLALSQRRE